MRIARIDKATNIVVNIEIADEEWVAANADDPTFLFVPVPDGDPVGRGDSYDAETGMFPPYVAPAENEGAP